MLHSNIQFFFISSQAENFRLWWRKGEDSFGNKDYCEALKCFHTSLSILSKKTEAKYLEDFMPLNYNIALTLERVYSVVDQK